MNFSFLTPLAPRTRVPLFGGVGGVGGCRGGGSKLLCVFWVLCVDLDPRSRATFFLYMDPLTHGVPGPNSTYPRSPPPMGPC